MTDGDRVLVLNPVCGSGDHSSDVRSLARERAFDVRTTDARGDARRLARNAAVNGASMLAVAGGDGTVNEAVHGLADAEAFAGVDLAVIPTGTANLFARSLGIDGIHRGFEIFDGGHRQQIDVGFADTRPFVNTCLAGLSATANAATPGELKRTLGVFAYILTTLKLLPDYDVEPLEITAEFDRPQSHPEFRRWRGHPLLVVIGNVFRFPGAGGWDRSSVDDGLLEVTILEINPVSDPDDTDPLSKRLVEGLFAVERFETTTLTIDGLDTDRVTFCLDGEEFTEATVDVSVREQCLSIFIPPE